MKEGLVKIEHSDRTVWVSPETARNIWAAQNRAAVWEAEARKLEKEKD